MPSSIVDELLNSGMIPNLKDAEVQSYLKKYVIALVGLAIAGVVIYKASFDPKSKTGEFYSYLIIAVLPILIGVFLISPVFSKSLDANGLFFYGVLAVILTLSIYMFYRVLNPASVSLITYGLNFIGILALIVGLAIIYRIFVRYIINLRGWGGFVLKLLFYLPCLLIDLLEILFVELKNSPKMVVVLFVLEIFVILAYLYLPKLFRLSIPSNMKVLLNKPVFLTQSTTIAVAQDLVLPPKDINNPGHEDDRFRHNFAVSMWVYVNQQPPSYAAYSKETDIFRYGIRSGSNTGHPRVAYFNDVDGGKPDQCIVYVSNVADSNGKYPSMSVQIIAQAWNHLVINYTESSVDLFLNGNLVQSAELDSKSYPSFDIADVIQVGWGDNTETNGGLMGAICNVKYHNRSLMPIEVAGEYNFKRYNNPPIYDQNSA